MEGEGGVDVDRLPASIRDKVIGVQELKDTDVNNILSAIADAARTALKDAGVTEVDLYSTVDAIVKASRPVIEGKGKK